MLSLIGKVATVVAGAVTFDVTPPGQAPVSLEKQWENAHPELSKVAADMSARMSSLLADMGSPSLSAGGITTNGEAVLALQDQLGVISQARREWIVNHAEIVGERTDVLHPARPRPARRGAPADTPRRGDRAGGPAGAGHDGRTRCGVRSDAGEARYAGRFVDLLSLDGSWFRERKFELSYHPDKSLKTFGVTSNSTVSAIATSAGEIADGAGTLHKALTGKPSAEQQELYKAKMQLDLLKTADDYEVLAATRARSRELAVLEQSKKLRDALK